MSKIHDNLPDFCFGLWAECPPHAPVAWGARGIADQGAGFGLLPDRQTMIGLDQLREPFSRLVLNKGPLEAANEEAKRLRHGWDPLKELVASPRSMSHEFVRWLNKRKKELEKVSDGNVSRWLSSRSNNGGMFRKREVISEAAIQEMLNNPRKLRELLHTEYRRRESYYRASEQQAQEWERNPPTPPPPPSHCQADEDPDWFEDEDEECGQEFVRKGKGRYSGCSLEDDCWVCENCGYQHYIDWEEHPDMIQEPDLPVLNSFHALFESRAVMRGNQSELFTLFDDRHLKILGNTNASHGYVYLIAFPEHEVIDLDKVMPSSKHPGFDKQGHTSAKPEDVFWSGEHAPPLPGDEIESENLGKCLVFGHLVFHNYLHINVLPLDPPEWYLSNIKQGDASRLTNVTGNEIK